MGSPSVDLRALIARAVRNIDRAALSNSTLFYVPPLAISVVSFALFRRLADLPPDRVNSLAVIIMSSVIVSLASTAGVQFVIYRAVEEVKQGPGGRLDFPSGIPFAAAVYAVVCSLAASVPVGLYLVYEVGMPVSDILHFLLLSCLYSAAWVLMTAFWARGLFSSPAVAFAVSFVVIFVLSYAAYPLDTSLVVWEYTAGVALLLALLLLMLLASGKGRLRPRRSGFVRLFRLATGSWIGILLQLLFVVALFLDKVIVWVAEGTSAGTGLQVLGPYTTGAFLGMLPTFSLIASAYYAEKIRRLSKGMYSGTLAQIRDRIAEYRRLYTASLLTTLGFGLVILIVVVLLSLRLYDTEVTAIAATVGCGALLLQLILCNTFVLAVFNRTSISVAAVVAVCAGVAGSAPFVASNNWFAALGFLCGSIAGFAISQIATAKLVPQFEYNAFRSFQGN